MDVLSLLKSRNRCLEKFLEASQHFLRQAMNGDFNGVTLFEAQRDGALHAFSLYDGKLSEAIRALGDIRHDSQLIESARGFESARVQLLAQIQSVDQAIVSKIEAERERLQSELVASQKASNRLKKFKSGWMAESGESLDRQV